MKPISKTLLTLCALLGTAAHADNKPLPEMICPKILNANMGAEDDYKNQYEPNINIYTFIERDGTTYSLNDGVGGARDSVDSSSSNYEDDKIIKFKGGYSGEHSGDIYATYTKANSTLEVEIVDSTYLIHVTRQHYLLQCNPAAPGQSPYDY